MKDLDLKAILSILTNQLPGDEQLAFPSGSSLRSDSKEDLTRIILHSRQSLNLLHSGHPDRPGSINNLANALWARFVEFSQIDDLDEAILCYQQSLDLWPTEDFTSRSRSLHKIATALCIRFDHHQYEHEIRAAISFFRQSLEIRPMDHPACVASLDWLAWAYYTCFQKYGQRDDVTNAILCFRRLIGLRPVGHPDRVQYLIKAANALRVRFDKFGQIEDLQDADSYKQQSLNLQPVTGHPDKSRDLNQISTMLIQLLPFGGLDSSDLSKVVSYHRQSLELQNTGRDPRQSQSLCDFAKSLGTKFYLDHLQIHTAPPNQAHSLRSLAGALGRRFDHLRQKPDIEEAISSRRQLLDILPQGNPHHPSDLNNLGAALHTRFDHYGQMEDLEEAISFYNQSLNIQPDGHPERSRSLHYLAVALRVRFDYFGRLNDLHDVISYNCLVLPPNNHPYRSRTLGALASALYAHFNKLGQVKDLEIAIRLFREASIESSAPPLHRLAAARAWTWYARENGHPSLGAAYSKMLTILQRSLLIFPTLALQYKFLGQENLSIPVMDAASFHIQEGRLQTAVEVLEQGRCLLWTRMKGYRDPLADLRKKDNELANRFDQIRRELENIVTFIDLHSQPGRSHPTSEPTSPARQFDAMWSKYRTYSRELDRLIHQIRQVDHYSEFLGATPIQELQGAASEGPIIITNISKYRSDAIIILSDGPLFHVPLDAGLSDIVLQLSIDVARMERGDGVHYKISGKGDRYPMVNLLRSLWFKICQPVVAKLLDIGIEEQSRIWWCPTGKLVELPIHAAGPYLPGQRNLSDMFISSYTPTLLSLIRSRRGVGNTHCLAPVRLLAAGQPIDLPKVNDELRHLEEIFESQLTVLRDAEANSNTIISKLPEYPWAHFACHGIINTQPFLSAFKLYKGDDISILRLIEAMVPTAELAFMAACHTAATERNAPDESISLAAAMQLCGFKSTIGTLWAMRDVDGPVLAKEFYSHLLQEGGGDVRGSAKALHLATKALQDAGVPPQGWATFVHIGV